MEKTAGKRGHIGTYKLAPRAGKPLANDLLYNHRPVVQVGREHNSPGSSTVVHQ